METMITQPDDYKHSKLVQKINALPEEALEQLSEYLDFLYYVIKTPIVLILAVWHKKSKDGCCDGKKHES